MALVAVEIQPAWHNQKAARALRRTAFCGAVRSQAGFRRPADSCPIRVTCIGPLSDRKAAALMRCE
jgi:hypothetical protein